jgi:hypothetical protein
LERPDKGQAGLAAKWNRSRDLVEIGNRLGASYPELELAAELETDVLLGDILTIEDVIAKLKAIQLAFTDGARTDGADAKAVSQTILWLQMQIRAGVAKNSKAA